MCFWEAYSVLTKSCLRIHISCVVNFDETALTNCQITKKTAIIIAYFIGSSENMNILIAGGTGFIGSFLVVFLKKERHHVTIVTRSRKKVKQGVSIIYWDGKSLKTDQKFDIIINLCGQSIADKKWSDKVKYDLLESRLSPTNALISFIKEYPSNNKPRLINASAIGFYPSSQNVQSEIENVASEHELFSKELVEKWESCSHRFS